MHALSFATAVAVSLIAAPAMAGKVDLAGLGSGQTYDQFIVGYRSGSPERGSVSRAKESLARAASAQVGGKALALKHLRRMGIGSDVVRIDRKLDRVEAESLMRQIAADPDVEYVEVDRRMQAFFTPNDTYYLPRQWDMYDTYGIRANNAWDVTQGAGVVVAVIDTGITDHSDLNANILPGYDFIDEVAVSNDGDGRDSDAHDPGDWIAANQCGGSHPARNSSWHGTHVAGTVAAVMNNGQGVAGVAPAAKVVPLRALGTCGGYDSDIADAIIWAAGGSVPGVPANPYPAEVINLSLGGQGACGSTTQSAINGAVGLGATLVVAAGNDNAPASGFSPANCNNVITVGATTKTGARAEYSNYGPAVDLAAPGSGILSTQNSGTTVPVAESYGTKSGTSMSTPHVAGVAALIQSVAAIPKTPAQVEALVKCTATPFPSTPSQPIGTGIVNAQNAVNVALSVPLSVSGNGGAVAAQTVGVRTLLAPGPGNASCNTQIFVSANPASPGSLQLQLVAPDGTIYPLPSLGGFGTQPFTLNLSGEAREGIWKLLVNNTSSTTAPMLGWGMTFN
ncbi:S8 family peptidase [Pseudoxanthomonas sacheonensis]|uniref:S8 family peptidase n=1 Tax=Pseudoxanthomonas sacheonensis TaxID=443615 RepID=UPI0013D55253|nr:S8 family peptidase [Pseudoxanthomonas sacheonensis]